MDAMRDAYTASELVQMLEISERSILRRAAREQWQSRKRLGRGGGHEWLVESMPAATRFSIASAVADVAVVEAAAVLAARTAPIYKDGKAVFANSVNTVNTPERQSESRQNTRLQARIDARAQSRAWAVQAAKNFVAHAALARSTGYDLFVAQYNTHTIDAPDWVRDALPSLSRASLHNWERALATQGSCAARYGQARLGCGVIEATPGMAALIAAQIIHTRNITAEEILQSIECEYAGETLPSMRTIQRFLREYRDKNALTLLKMHNPDRYKSQHQAAAGSRSEDVTFINERWEMDSSPADIILSDGIRYTLLGCIDIYTRRAKLHIEKTSNSQGICTLLRRSIVDFGVPHTILMDNGSDYTSIQVVTALKNLEVEGKNCVIFSPEQKPHIERIFGTFARSLKRLPGFVGHSVADRQAIRSEQSFAQRLSRKNGKNITIEVPMTFDEFQSYCDHYCENVYGERIHSALKCSPNDRAATAAGTVRRVENERALDVLLLPLGGTRVVRKGMIKVNGASYKAPALGLHEGQEVSLRRHDDAGYVYVFTLDGNFVCIAQDPDMTGASTRDLALATTHVQKAALTEAVKDAKATVKAIKPQRLVQAIRAHQETKAQQARMQREAAHAPLPEYSHTTPALDQAAIAALAGRHTGPAPMSADEAAARKQMEEDWYLDNIPKVEARGPEDLTSREAFVTYKMLMGNQDAGIALTKAQVKWLMGYQSTTHCAVHIEMFKDFGEALLEGIMPYAI